MSKIRIAGNLLLALGFLTMAVTMFVFAWPLVVGLAALLLASRFFKFFGDTRAAMTKRWGAARINILTQPQLASSQLPGVSESSAAR